MVYVSVEDFYDKAGLVSTMSREEELACAKKMKDGDETARERLIQSYLPMVAGHIKHGRCDMQSLGLVYSCLQALETAVDKFDFFQEGETFSHRLSWYLRQATTEYIVESRNV